MDVNKIDSLKKRSALHWAVVAKNFQIVKMLIDASIIIIKKKLNFNTK